MTLKTKLISIVSAILLFQTSMSYSSSGKKAKDCQKVNQKIESIQKKMRNGYTPKQGRKYHKQLNKLYKKQFESCL
ncbi:hypothetical protein C9J03_01475 [Photobacterium gaetbulicola]|uniref:Uncharacterized protein n=2 Tax=Photobacterium gaetbulicola TaxID=1295392 RepID=A0A0C5W366_9GAMM|nr:hypothetical protein H744_1c0786 [Photobacterium gaetbulicola Gung47]KHT65456.1 hypothetical protein RJ45_01060 [Photobacterium gaetbulicola]PSU14773.1 hypothetical protein C9J03_01475 [Photobacterium gaetbulicola]